MKNLLIIVPGLGGGGQERMAVYTVDILKDYYNVYLATFQIASQAYSVSCEIINIDLPAVNSKLGKVFNAFQRAKRIKKIKKDKRIDVAFSFNDAANLANILSRGYEKVVVSLRSYRKNQIEKKNLIQGFIYKKADVVVGISERLTRDIARTYAKEIKTVATLYNTCDVEKIRSLAVQDSVVEITPPTIIGIGRLEKEKAFGHLIGAYAIARNQISNLRLIIMGNGSQGASLAEYAKKLGVEKTIEFVPFQQNPFAIESKCQLLVMTSLSEGFGNVITEAMACQLPIISVDCPSGPREILTGEALNVVCETIEYSKYGILVPPFSSDCSYEPEKEKILAQAIVEIISDREKAEYYKKAGAVRVCDFSFDVYKKKILQILEN